MDVTTLQGVLEVVFVPGFRDVPAGRSCGEGEGTWGMSLAGGQTWVLLLQWTCCVTFCSP